MKTSHCDLWNVISTGTNGAPPSLHLLREEPASGKNRLPWVLSPAHTFLQEETGLIGDSNEEMPAQSFNFDGRDGIWCCVFLQQCNVKF